MFGEQMIDAVRRSFFGKRMAARPAPLPEEQCAEQAPAAVTMPTEQEQLLYERELAQQAFLMENGCSADEVRALYLLRQRYENGGSDRAPVLYHLEFLRRLIANGKLER